MLGGCFSISCMQTFLVHLSETRVVSALQPLLCSRSGSERCNVSLSGDVLGLLLELLGAWCPGKGTNHSQVGFGGGFTLCCSNKLCAANLDQEHKRKMWGLSTDSSVGWQSLSARFTAEVWTSSSRVLVSLLVVPQQPQSALESAGGGPESCRALQISSVSLENGTVPRNEGVRASLTDLTLHLLAGS